MARAWVFLALTSIHVRLLRLVDAGALRLRHNLSSRGGVVPGLVQLVVRDGDVPADAHDLEEVTGEEDSGMQAAQGEAGSASKELDIEDRPSHGQTKPDIIQFGVLCRDFFGADFKTGVFGVDLVLELQWTDVRAASLAGTHTKIMSGSSAARRIWMPDITVTNRAQNGIDVISSQVVVDHRGVVTLVKRMLVRVKTRFEVRSYPFDSQSLDIRLASESYMSNQVELQPFTSRNMSGVTSSRVFDGSEWTIQKTTIHAFEDYQSLSSIRKSRGELKMIVQRRTQPYFSTLLGPEAILVAFSWTVFLYPMIAAFSMPKVATSMISFMTLMALTLKSNNHLPVRGEEAWLDVYEEACTALVWTSSWFNILIEVANHEFGLPAVAKQKQRELALLYPVIASISLGALIGIGVFKKQSAFTTDFSLFETKVLMIRIFLYIVLFGYGAGMIWIMFRTYKEKDRKSDQNEEADIKQPGASSFIQRLQACLGQRPKEHGVAG
jgi:hypothetical protein